MTLPNLVAGYIDTTALLPIARREEPVGRAIRQKLDSFNYLLSANFLEAELRAVYAAEDVGFDVAMLSGIRWIMPDRRLDAEMTAVLTVAKLPAARVWHLAVALFFAELVPGLVFITLDEQQETVARELGLTIA